jgi:hypothetical protein
MKKLITLFGLLMICLYSYTQTATIKDIELNNIGFYTSFINDNGEIFNIGDTITLGKAYGILEYKCVANRLTNLYLHANAYGSFGTIKKIELKKNHINIIVKSTPLSFVIYDFQEALKIGEIVSSILTPDEALTELKKWKDKLDLELITQDEYNKKKEEFSKFIK